MNTTELAIDVRGLTKRFGTRTVVNGIDLAVRAAASSASWGPTAAARPPPCACSAACSRPTAARALPGLDFRRESAALKRQVGYMTQKFASTTTSRSARTWISSAACSSCRSGAAPSTRACSASAWKRRGQLAGALSAAGSSAWRWPPACCTGRSCCCWTSPPPASTPRRGASSGTRSPPAHEGITVLVATHYMDEAERCRRDRLHRLRRAARQRRRDGACRSRHPRPAAAT